MRPGNTVVVDIQAGDGGKGKIVDLVCDPYDYVVRFQGGHNAGHTVKIGKETSALHLLPSGILHPGKNCVMGNGMVIDPRAAAAEIEKFDCEGRLFISDRAHLITPWHPKRESQASGHYGAGKIGTTGRGIGPAYEDKAARKGLRVGAIRNWEVFTKECADILLHSDYDKYVRAAEKLQPYICNTGVLLNRAARHGLSILFEGAQGYLLDIDQGSYPFVTSSNPTFGGACTGTGVALKNASVLGIAKAYMTRVGGGPFPTKDSGRVGQYLHDRGEEKGTSTGRDRDCGWFDAVVAREAIMVNGVDALVITKLDVLTGLEVLRICIHYELDGKMMDYIPADAEDFERCQPGYVELPGWNEDIRGVRRFQDLPGNAQHFLRQLEDLCGVPIKIVSVGPERTETMILDTVQVMPWMDTLLRSESAGA